MCELIPSIPLRFRINPLTFRMFDFLKFVKAYLMFVKFLLVTAMFLTFPALQVESQHRDYYDFNRRIAYKVHIYETKLLNFQYDKILPLILFIHICFTYGRSAIVLMKFFMTPLASKPFKCLYGF